MWLFFSFYISLFVCFILRQSTSNWTTAMKGNKNEIHLNQHYIHFILFTNCILPPYSLIILCVILFFIVCALRNDIPSDLCVCVGVCVCSRFFSSSHLLLFVISNVRAMCENFLLSIVLFLFWFSFILWDFAKQATNSRASVPLFRFHQAILDIRFYIVHRLACTPHIGYLDSGMNVYFCTLCVLPLPLLLLRLFFHFAFFSRFFCFGLIFWVAFAIPFALTLCSLFHQDIFMFCFFSSRASKAYNIRLALRPAHKRSRGVNACLAFRRRRKKWGKKWKKSVEETKRTLGRSTLGRKKKK